MKKVTSSKKGAKDKPKETELRKPSKLKPLKSKDVKRGKIPKGTEDDDDIVGDDDLSGLDSDFDSGLSLDDDDDDF